MLPNEDIVVILKPDGICSLTFVVDKFSRLFSHPSIFSIIYCVNNKWCFIRFLYWLKSNILVSL